MKNIMLLTLANKTSPPKFRKFHRKNLAIFVWLLKKMFNKNLDSKKLWHFLNSIDRKVSVTIKLITGCLIKNGTSFSILCLLDHFSSNFLKPLALS